MHTAVASVSLSCWLSARLRDKSDSSSRSSHCLLVNVTCCSDSCKDSSTHSHSEDTQLLSTAHRGHQSYISFIFFQPSWPQLPVPEIITLKNNNILFFTCCWRPNRRTVTTVTSSRLFDGLRRPCKECFTRSVRHIRRIHTEKNFFFVSNKNI